MIKAIYQQASSVLSRNFRRRPWRVVEFRRYNDASLRQIGWTLCLGTLAIYAMHLYPNPAESWIAKDIDYALHQEKYINKAFKEYEDPKNLGFTYSGYSYSEILQGMKESYRGRYITSWITLLWPFFTLLLAVYPRWRPVRFDPIRRLIYTWSFGRFYIIHLHDKQWPLQQVRANYRRAMLRVVPAMEIHLPHAKNPQKTITRALGVFPPVVESQYADTYNFLNHYMVDGDLPCDPYAPCLQSPGFLWMDLLRGLMNFSLFPGFGYNERKTEKAIQRFLAMNNIMDRRQVFLDHPDDPENPFSKEELAGK